MRNKKIRNLNLGNFVVFIGLLMPLIYVLFSMLCRAISMSGVTTDSNFDFMALFTSSISQFSYINVLGLDSLNTWLFTYVFKEVSNSGMLVVKFVIWYIEYFVALELFNIVVQVLLIIPNVINKYWGCN
jgi:hypothetical protein